MTEKQFERFEELLETINSKLSDIVDAIDSVHEDIVEENEEDERVDNVIFIDDEDDDTDNKKNKKKCECKIDDSKGDAAYITIKIESEQIEGEHDAINKKNLEELGKVIENFIKKHK